MKRWKVAIMGSGSIGATMAYSLFLRCPRIDLVIVNRNQRKSWAKAFDISHCAPELAGRSICSLGMEECVDADVVVITAGSLPRENGTRADVLRDNIEIFQKLLPTVARNNPNALILNITNPVDAMAYAARKLTGFPGERVMGSGTELDGMRLRHLTAKKYRLSPGNLLLDVIGEHGDSMVPLWSTALYEGKTLAGSLRDFDPEARNMLRRATVRAGWDIRQAGEHSCYAISFSATRIIEGLLGISDRTLLVSTRLNGEYGIDDVYLSLPTRLGPQGVEKRLLPELTDEELAELRLSAEAVKRQMDAVDQLI